MDTTKKVFLVSAGLTSLVLGLCVEAGLLIQRNTEQMKVCQYSLMAEFQLWDKKKKKDYLMTANIFQEKVDWYNNITNKYGLVTNAMKLFK